MGLTNNNRVVIRIIALVGVVVSCTTTQTLDELASVVQRRYPVQEIRALALVDSLAAFPDRFVVFDTREREEYSVSRLRGAVRVDPDVESDTFLRTHQARVAGKTAVFYCSVGYRSSAVVDRLVAATGDTSGYVNLRGGIFNWYMSGNPVYDADGATDRVHPYDAVWGRFLTRAEAEP